MCYKETVELEWVQLYDLVSDVSGVLIEGAVASMNLVFFQLLMK